MEEEGEEKVEKSREAQSAVNRNKSYIAIICDKQYIAIKNNKSQKITVNRNRS